MNHSNWPFFFGAMLVGLDGSGGGFSLVVMGLGWWWWLLLM